MNHNYYLKYKSAYMKNKKIAIAVATGVAAGALAGYFLSTEKGRAVRDKLADLGMDLLQSLAASFQEHFPGKEAGEEKENADTAGEKVTMAAHSDFNETNAGQPQGNIYSQ
jgi:uncharacterized membrane protein YebE (DUF533 family)